MSEVLARFRDLKGIGPATEARLHEAGIYSWEALATAASALAAVGGGSTAKEVAGLVAAQRAEAGSPQAPRAPGAERLEAFVLRLAVTGDGDVLRSTVSHVRSAVYCVRNIQLRIVSMADVPPGRTSCRPRSRKAA